MFDCLFTEQVSFEEIGFVEGDDLDEGAKELEKHISQMSNDEIVRILGNIGYLSIKENENEN